MNNILFLSLKVIVPVWFMVIFQVGALAAAEFSDLSQDEQRMLRPYEQQWELLSADKQQQLRNGVRAWQELDPEQRQAVQRQFQAWRELSPEEQQTIRERYRHFQQLDPQQQQQLRETRRNYLALPEETRYRLRQQWENLNPNEQQVYRRRLESASEHRLGQGEQRLDDRETIVQPFRGQEGQPTTTGGRPGLRTNGGGGGGQSGGNGTKGGNR